MVTVSRVLSVIVAVVGLLWLLQVGSVGFDPPPPGMRAVTDRLIGGQQYDADVLAKFDADTSKALQRHLCVPDELKALSMIRLARVRLAYAAGTDAAKGDASKAEASKGDPETPDAVRDALSKMVGEPDAPAGDRAPGMAADADPAAAKTARPDGAGREARAPSDGAPNATGVGTAPNDPAASLDPAIVAERLQRMQDLGYATAMTLYCSPYQSLGWTILALGEYFANGHTPRLDTLIDLSYRTGPYEGWPLARRLDLLALIAPDLSPEQSAMLKAQIDAVVDSDLHPMLAALYVQQDEAHRGPLRKVFAELSARDQDLVTKVVRRLGADIELPLATPRGQRPWDG